MMWQLIFVLVSLSVFVTCQSADLSELIENYRKWRLEDSPEYARILGYHGYDERVEQYTISILDERKLKSEEFLGQLENINRKELGKLDRLKYDVINATLNAVIEGHKWKMYGPMNPVNFLEILSVDQNGVAPDNPTSYADFFSYITRIFGYAEQALNHMIRMRQAIAHNTTNHWVSMENAVTIIDELIGDSDTDCQMYAPLNETLETTNITDGDKGKLRALAKATIAEFRRNYQVLKEFILTEYKNSSRSEYGVSSFRNGADYYRACLKWHLTLDMTPEEIHQLGLREVDRIHSQMKKVMSRLDSKGTVHDFFQTLLNDSKFILSSKEEVIQRYEDILRNRIWKKLPKYFKDFPNRQVEVKEMLFDRTGGSYQSGSPDGSRPGVFYVNVHRLTNNPTFSMPALALHEGDPGHHFQDIFTAKSPIPDYQKKIAYRNMFAVPLNFPYFTTFIEGWALYAESLGEEEELGIYEDDYELMGRYSQEMFRACRLVIDTGLHYYNWSRERAIQYLLTYTSKSRASATNDVDRYITWPGQACAYKIGELKIKELRKMAESRLGKAFDIREFHAVVLESGPVPLTVLEANVKEWLTQQDSLNRLLSDSFEWRLKNSPEYATVVSHKYNDQLLRYSVKDMETQFTEAMDFLDRLNSIDRESVGSYSQQISYDVLKNMLQTFTSGYQWKDYGALNPIHFMTGLQTADPLSRWSNLPMDTQGDFINYIRRLELVPRQIDEMMNLTKRSIELGTTNHNVSLNRIPGNIDKITSIPDMESSMFYEPYSLHASRIFVDINERRSIEARLKTAVTKTIQKLKDLKIFILEDYMPHTRNGLGVGSLPHGQNLYRAALKFHTDLDISPEEVHVKGKAEVERILKQMRKVMTELNYPQDWSIRQVYNNLTGDTRFLLNNGDETLQHFKEIIFDRIAPVIPKFFRDPPELPLEVLGSPTDGTAGQYFPGTADGSRSGVFLANVHRPEDNPTFTMVSLSLHEAIPGHHLSSNYILKSDMPDFRKYMEWKVYSAPYFFPFYNAYVEGWALYCEYLGEEMGIYRDKYELLGRYSDEMKRAARLVIDTGIHYYNWSRTEAIEFMLNHTALSEQAAANQIDRYVTWPGQATGYKMGEIKIKEIRHKAEKKLGSRFDIRDFHDTLLSSGPLPFNILERVIDTWSDSIIHQPDSGSAKPDCDHVTGTSSVTSAYSPTIVILIFVCFLK